MLFVALAEASERLGATRAKREKTGLLASLLRELSPTELAVAVPMLVGEPRQGRTGVGWATIGRAEAAPVDTPSLTILDVDRALDELAAVSGPGSAGHRSSVVQRLFEQATRVEQRLLWGLLGGELRHGALAGVMLDAIAAGASVPAAAVRRAHMLSGELGATAVAAFAGGAPALAAIGLDPGRAVEPMLASPAADVADALAQTGLASVEWKLDGARVQAHRSSGAVRLFTRNLNDVTDRLPGVVDLVSGLPGGDLVLDGEVAEVRNGVPRSFQDTMGDFGAGADTGRGSSLGAYFFDALHLGERSLIDEALSVRRDVLMELVPESARLPGLVTTDVDAATAFFDDAVERGLEGVVVKALDSPYAAGRRGGSWRKVKPVHTVDLVVLAAEWGHGRRTGWLSNLHLGARGADGSFVMVGKTFKGLTGELLRWQTEALQSLAIGQETQSLRRDPETGQVVHVRPELVVEIALDGVQRSTRYPGGVALRFARVKRYRPDKRADEADPIERLQAMLTRG